MLIRQVHQRSVLLATIAIFLNKGFKLQLNECSGCQDVLMISMNLSDIAILRIHGVVYHCIINGISKSEAIIKHKILLSHIKMA